MKSEYSIWLLPEEAHERTLNATIADLAKIQGESAFIPHVTIQGDLCRSADELADPLAALATETSRQRWQVEAVECGDQFFRCLYLRFDADASLSDLQDRVRVFTQSPHGLSPFPHLSLAYGKVTDATRCARDRLAAVFAKQEIVFNRIALVRSSKDVPIAEWRILAQRFLS